MPKQVFRGDLSIEAPDQVTDYKIIQGGVVFPGQHGFLDTMRVSGRIDFGPDSVNAFARVDQFVDSWALMEGDTSFLYVDNGSDSSFHMHGGFGNTISVEKGNAAYHVFESEGSTIYDGKGSSQFQIFDSIWFKVYDGAGDDRFLVHGGSDGDIFSGTGEDLYEIWGSVVTIHDFDPLSDTLIVDGDEVVVTGDMQVGDVTVFVEDAFVFV